MEEHCSRPDEMCNRVQNIFAIWNSGWKGFPAWVKQENNFSLHFCVFFYTVDVVELFMMVTVMQLFFLTVSCTTLGYKSSKFHLFAFCQRPSKNTTRRKSLKDCFQCFHKMQSSKCQQRQDNYRTMRTTSFTCPGVHSGAKICLFFLFWIWHYHFVRAKLWNRSMQLG